jgi:hypothetical protein
MKSVHFKSICCMRTEGRIDIIKLIVALRNYAKAANKKRKNTAFRKVFVFVVRRNRLRTETGSFQNVLFVFEYW